MIRTEYLRFLQTLNNPAVSEETRKIANMMLAHLDDLVPLTSYQGQRVKRIVTLAQTNWKTLSTKIQPLLENIKEQLTKISQLKSISIGPFRGFARQEKFDLESRLVLIYGPNGTGKSSFCEALEYSMLGNVIEAESKRFRDQREYLKNAHVNQFNPPNITAMDELGNEITITPNETLYRFCFVEKNRIDSFSRIAAQTPAKQTELISTLFGLESFTEFVRNFTTEIDEKYIDLVGKKAIELAKNRQTLLGAEHQIKINTDELQTISKEEQQIANEYRQGITFSQMVSELHGSEKGYDLHLMSEFPQRPAQYKNSYIFIKKNDIQELYYIKPDGNLEKIEIDDFNFFEEKLNAIKNNDNTKLHLSVEQIKEIVTSNEGHTCGEIPGKIRQLEAELKQPSSAKNNLTIVAFEALSNSIADDIVKLAAKQEELTAASQQLSFKNLYEAISQVQQSSPEKCPACKTPLSQVTVNPYTYAGEELPKLQQLALIQHEAQILDQKIKQSLFNFSQVIKTCLRVQPQNNPLQSYQLDNGTQPDIKWWNALLRNPSEGLSPLQNLALQVKHLENKDKEIDQREQIRRAKETKLDQLKYFSEKITKLQTRRQIANAAIASAEKSINDFDIKNAQLITDVEAEKIMIQENKIIASAYASFVLKLNTYCNDLPAQLVADLGETVVTLYNAFNRKDSPSELLANVKLPLEQNQRLEIAFKTEPSKYYDALHILSEGHIRCLGLAILLSKNLKENTPLLIFDDPVNAIDDEHRESIRRTLFEDHYFAKKQVILTCHGEEFFKDIYNLLPAQTASKSKSFVFLPRLDELHIQIDFKSAPRNYILAARGHISRNEIREALSKSRQALETLTQGKIWKYVSKHGDGNLSLKLRSFKAPIELRNLADQLKSRIAKENFGDPEKNSVLIPLDSILSINGESREWSYLNKGTHEESDRSEFDRGTVEAIISNLEKLDAALA